MNWHPHVKLEKFKGDYPGMTAEQIKASGVEPYEVVECDGNVLLNSGINSLLFTGLIGTIAHPVDGTYGCVGVGDSSVVATAIQTGLQAASNHLWVLLNAIPSIANQTLTFTATFTSLQANWAWNEWCLGMVPSGLPLDAANPTGGFALNRRVQSLGTKASGTTWTFTGTISIS